MVKTYVVAKRFNMTFAHAYIEKGDIVLYDSNNSNKVSVYRNRKLVATTFAPNAASVPALIASGWIKEVKDTPEAPPVQKPSVKLCTTCGLGPDNNGDGDCAACFALFAPLTEQIEKAETSNQKLALIDGALAKIEYLSNQTFQGQASSSTLAFRSAELREQRTQLLSKQAEPIAKAIVETPDTVTGDEASGVAKFEDAKAAGFSDAEAQAIGFEEQSEDAGAGGQKVEGEEAVTENDGPGADEGGVPADAEGTGNAATTDEIDFSLLKYNDMLVYARTKYGLTYQKNPAKPKLIEDIQKAKAAAESGA
jgi:hypothetical protein